MPAPSSETFTILNVSLQITSDDAEFLDEFERVFGGRRSASFDSLPQRALTAELRVDEGPFGTLIVRGDALADPAGFLLGFSSPTIPLRELPASNGWRHIAVGDDDQPMFSFRGEECRFRRTGRWRRVLAHFLFLRMLALRGEALFFHAASVGIGGKGVLLVGPKGAGKSTVSLGLASRGHTFLGDETAAYVPATNLLLPFQRPAGIKPGPRAARVSSLLDKSKAGARDEEGMLRVDAASLFGPLQQTPLPLGAVIFLDGFSDEPALEKIQAGRDELAQMQPIATTLSTAPASARVFQMIRLLGSVICYKMTAGNPDPTIEMLERVLRHELDRQ